MWSCSISRCPTRTAWMCSPRFALLASAAGGHHDHRLWHGGERGPRHAVRRHQLHPEAVGQRETAGRRARRRRPPEGGRRKHPAEARTQAALQLRKHRGQERAHAEDFRPGRAGCAQPLDGAAARRKRNGQGTDRQGDPSEFHAARPAVRAGELRIDAARSARIDAVRPRQRRVHQRGCVEERTCSKSPTAARSSSTKSAP